MVLIDIILLKLSYKFEMDLLKRFSEEEIQKYVNFFNSKSGSKHRKLFDDLRVDLRVQYACETCKEMFSSLLELKIHTFMKHVCLECFEHFRLASKYASHRKTHHDSFYCNVCPNEIQFPSKANLMSHFALCHGEFLGICCSDYNCWSTVMKETKNMCKKTYSARQDRLQVPGKKTESKSRNSKKNSKHEKSKVVNMETQVLSKPSKNNSRRRKEKSGDPNCCMFTDKEGVNGEAIPQEVQQEVHNKKIPEGPQSHLVSHLQKEAKHIMLINGSNINENTVEFKVTFRESIVYQNNPKRDKNARKPMLEGEI